VAAALRVFELGCAKYAGGDLGAGKPSITDWIGAVSSSLGVVVIVVGLIVAFKQLGQRWS